MSREIVLATRTSGERVRYLLEVFEEENHWTSTLVRLDEKGEPEPGLAAPRFYGLTADQARRRMLTVLENDYDEVVSSEQS